MIPRATCAWCTHYRTVWTSPRGAHLRCEQGLPVKGGQHDCAQFQREPGADDDRDTHQENARGPW